MATQAIKYQTTGVEASKSANEIGVLIQRYGATRFEVRWDEFGNLTGIRFAVRAEGIGEMPVRLDAQTDRIEQILTAAKKKASRYNHIDELGKQRIREQAYRIAWRQLKDFVEQALLAVETGLFNLGAAFMAHVEVRDDATGEPITMSEFLLRRATVVQQGEALRIMPASEAPTVRALPPGRSVGGA